MVVPQCSRTHLAARLLGRFYLSEPWLVLPTVLREQGGPAAGVGLGCEVMARQSVAFGYHCVHRDRRHHGWEGALGSEAWSMEKGQMGAK